MPRAFVPLVTMPCMYVSAGWREHRIIVSADADFSMLLAISGRTKPSFLLFRCADRRPPVVLRLLLGNLDLLRDDIDAGCVAVFEDERIRVRRLPL